MRISVAICTWNRSQLLQRTLERLCELDADDRYSWELVLVDNNSTDDTSQVIDRFADDLPLRAVRETKQGHSWSRNRAIAESTGDYIVWTDNDVLVCPQWLSAYYDAFSAEPQVAFFGGAIDPVFDPPGRPDWLESTWGKCHPVYAARDLGRTPVELNENRLPYGANFAVRLDVQREHLFDPTLGRVKSGMMGEDETHVLRRIVRSGGKGRWVPDARVQHIVPADRATEKYVRSYFVGQGMANVAFNKPCKRRVAALLDCVCQSLLYRIKRNRTDSDEWVSHLIRAGLSWGEYSASTGSKTEK